MFLTHHNLDDSVTTHNDSGSSYAPFDNEREESSSCSDRSESPIIGLVEPLYDCSVKKATSHGSKNHKIIVSKNYNLLQSATVDASKKSQITNKRIWDKRDVCIFCEKSITNFSRHLIRQHGKEIEVAKLSSLKCGTTERKNVIHQIRKRGNCFNNIRNAPCLKPVRRPNQFSGQNKPSDYLPCKFCFGLFLKKYLSRHLKLCSSKKMKINVHEEMFKVMRNLFL